MKNGSTRLLERQSLYDRVNYYKRMPCMDCGQTFPEVCMDFDHRDADAKVRPISQMVNRRSSWATIRAEMDKCDLVCSNCHRIRTQSRRHIYTT